MALIRDISEDAAVIHRVKEFNGRTYTTHCGKTITITHARPANRAGYRCPSCRQTYKTNLGVMPASAQAQTA